MIDQIYNVSDISNGDNQIRIDSSSQTFVIGVDTTLLERDVIKIEESFFIVPGTPPVENQETSFEIPNQEIEDPAPIVDTYALSDMIDLTAVGDCLPYSAISEFSPTFNSETISIYDDLEFDYVQSIDSIRIDQGSLRLEVTNNFPFEIDELKIVFNETVDGVVDEWESLLVSNVSTSSPNNNKEDETVLTQRRLPGAISSEPSIVITDDGSGNPSPCRYYIDPNPIAGLVPVEAGCTEAILPADYSDASVEWIGGDCWIYLEGWQIDGSESINVEVEFSIDNMYDVWGHIVFETEETITQSIETDDSISLITAHIANIEDTDTNRIVLDVTNGLFTPIDIELTIENIVDDWGRPFTYQEQIEVHDSNDNTVIEIDLSDNDIRSPDIGTFEELVITNKISFDSENTQILFGESYSLNINEMYTTPIQFDELYVDLENFSTPNIDMASVPAGFGNIGLPTLRFNLYMYNEIDAPLTLNLDLMGITETDTIKIHVEPELKFPDNYEGIDSTTISIYSDTLEVQGSSFTDYYQLEARIDTLFSRDEIKVSGNATLNGESSLKPGKSFWGDVGIELRPLTIVFPENVTFSPQDQTELSLDESTRENMSNGLIEAELFIEVGNSMPIGATFNMLASNSTYFPLCFDTLITGTQEDQIVSDTCLTLIEEIYSPDFIYVDKKENGEVISAEFMNIAESEDSEDEGEDELVSDTTATFFVGRLLALDLGIPTNLDENGFILEKSITYNNILLDTTKMNWITDNELLYISPLINNVRTSIDTLPGYVTFHTIDYLQIRSFLTLIMDSQIITGTSNED